MKTVTFLAVLIIGMGFSLISETKAEVPGAISHYYSDATYTTEVGHKGYGTCRGKSGITTVYVITEDCF